MSHAPPTRHRRFQFGLRALLVVVTLLALFTAWIGHLNRRATQRTRLTAELVSRGILVDLEEPNWLGQIVRKYAPRREPWLRERLGSGWLGYPTVLGCWEMKEEHLSENLERIKRLGTVREVHLRQAPSPQVAEAMRRELAGIDVVDSGKAGIGTYYQRRLSQPIFAFEGAAFLALIGLVVIGTLAGLAWRLTRRWLVYYRTNA